MSGYERLLSLSVSLASACTGPFGAFRDDEATPVPDCEISVASTWPSDGSTSAYHRDPIEFVLSGADNSAEVDSPVPGTTEILDGGRLVLRVVGKGGRERAVPVPDRLGQLLAGYGWPAVSASTVYVAVRAALAAAGFEAQLRLAG